MHIFITQPTQRMGDAPGEEEIPDENADNGRSGTKHGEYVACFNPKCHSDNASGSVRYTSRHHPVYLGAYEQDQSAYPCRYAQLGTIFRLRDTLPDEDATVENLRRSTRRAHPFHVQDSCVRHVETLSEHGWNPPKKILFQKVSTDSVAKIRFGHCARHFAVVLPTSALKADATCLSDIFVSDQGLANSTGEAVVSFMQIVCGLLGRENLSTKEGIHLSAGKKTENELVAALNAIKRTQNSIADSVFPSYSMVQTTEVEITVGEDGDDGRGEGEGGAQKKRKLQHSLPDDTVAEVPPGYKLNWDRLESPFRFDVEVDGARISLPRYAIHFEYVYRAADMDPDTTNHYLEPKNIECIVIHFWLYDPRISLARGIARLLTHNLQRKMNEGKVTSSHKKQSTTEDMLNDAMLKEMVVADSKSRHAFTDICSMQEWIGILDRLTGNARIREKYDSLTDAEMRCLHENWSVIDPVYALDFDWMCKYFEYSRIVPENNAWNTAGFRLHYASFYIDKRNWHRALRCGPGSAATGGWEANVQEDLQANVFLYRYAHRVVSIPIPAVCSVVHCMRFPHMCINTKTAPSYPLYTVLEASQTFDKTLRRIFDSVYAAETIVVKAQGLNVFDEKFLTYFTDQTVVSVDQIALTTKYPPAKLHELRHMVAHEVHNILSTGSNPGVPPPVQNIMNETNGSKNAPPVGCIVPLFKKEFGFKYYDRLTPLGTFYTNYIENFVEGYPFEAMGNHSLYMNILMAVAIQCQMRKGYQLTLHVSGPTSAGKSRPFSLMEGMLCAGSFTRRTSESDRAHNTSENNDALFIVIDDGDKKVHIFAANDLAENSGERKSAMTEGLITRVVPILTSVSRRQLKIETWCRVITFIISNNSNENVPDSLKTRVNHIAVASSSKMNRGADRKNFYREGWGNVQSVGAFKTIIQSLQRFCAVVNVYIASGVIVYSHQNTVDRIDNAVSRILSLMEEINGERFEFVARDFADKVRQYVYANILIRVWSSICFGALATHPDLDPERYTPDGELRLVHAINELGLISVTDEDVLCGLSFFTSSFPKLPRYTLTELIISRYNEKYADTPNHYVLGTTDLATILANPAGFYNVNRSSAEDEPGGDDDGGNGAAAPGFNVGGTMFAHVHHFNPRDVNFDYLDIGWVFRGSNSTEFPKDTFIKTVIVAQLMRIDPHIDEASAIAAFKELAANERVSGKSIEYVQHENRLKVSEEDVSFPVIETFRARTGGAVICVARAWIDKLFRNSDFSYYANPRGDVEDLLNEHYENPLYRILKFYPYNGMAPGMKIVLPGFNHWRATDKAKQGLPQVLGYMETTLKLPQLSPNADLQLYAKNGIGAFTWDGSDTATDPNACFDTHEYQKTLIPLIREIPLLREFTQDEIDQMGGEDEARAHILNSYTDKYSPYQIWKRFQTKLREAEPNVDRNHFPLSCVQHYNHQLSLSRDQASRPRVKFSKLGAAAFSAFSSE